MSVEYGSQLAFPDPLMQEAGQIEQYRLRFESFFNDAIDRLQKEETLLSIYTIGEDNRRKAVVGVDEIVVHGSPVQMVML